ncbi:MAG: 1-acyl-sn-glycerol-3-phosphate acyltransferase [Bacteroidia bacterium]
MVEEQIPQIINVDKIFKDKNPGLYNLLPGFVMRYLKRIIHQDKMNLILKKGEGIYGVDFANIVLNEMGVQVSCSGIENVPETGPVIIVSNHPLAGLDAMAMISYVGKKRKDIRFLVNDILTRLPNFGEVFVPVNKLGINAKSNLVRIEEIYASDVAVMLFPAGMCSRIFQGKIQDFDWQKSFVTKAQKYQTTIIPVLVKGKNSPRFYNLSWLRTKLGIKANIEMFYLPDEMFKQKGNTIELIIGKPIFPAEIPDKSNLLEMAQLIRGFVYNLSTNPSQLFQDYLKKLKEH